MPSLIWTGFVNRAAFVARERQQEWRDLILHLQSAGPFRDKASCPWVKLARFGNVRSNGNSLRNNRNVKEVTGVEGDYDGEVVQPEQALLLLERAGIRAAIYTSPSHTTERPRWRVLAPFSLPLAPTERARMLARVNGALGGILTSESFTLSQSYYYGRVIGQTDYRVLVTYGDPDDGSCIDDLAELDEVAILPQKIIPDDDAPDYTHAIALAVDQLGRRLRTGDGRRNLLRAYIGDKSVRGLSADELGVLCKDVVDRYFDPADSPNWEDINSMIEAFTREDARERQAVQDTVGEWVEKITQKAAPSEALTGLPIVWAEEVSADAVGILQLVEDMLTQGGLSVMYGESNSGKSFMACDLACSVGSGMQWMGKRTVEGAVLYVAGEGSESIKMRVLAWRQYHGLSPKVAIVPVAVNLLDRKADMQKIIEACQVVEKRYSQKVSLIIVDTLARAFGGGNENASEDMGAVISHADMVRAKTGAHLMFVHHAGKDASKGSRGHSSLKAATDTEIEVVGEQETHLHTATVTKQRDLGSRGDALTAKFAVVEMGTDQWGKPVTTCLVQPTTEQATPTRNKRQRGVEVREAVKDVLHEQPTRSMRRPELVRRVVAAGFTSSPTYRALSDLLEDGEITETQGVVQLALRWEGSK